MRDVPLHLWLTLGCSVISFLFSLAVYVAVRWPRLPVPVGGRCDD